MDEGTAVSDARPRSRSLSRTSLEVVRRGLVSFNEDRATLLSAAISYYALFSLFPLIILAVAVFGIFLRSEDLQQAVLDAIVDAIPVETPYLEAALRNVAGISPTLTLVALLAMTWSATALIAAVRRSLIVVFDVSRSLPMLRGKALDYLMLPILGLAFLASFALTTIWQVLVANARDELGFIDGSFSWTWQLGALAIPAMLTFVVFTLLY